MTSIDPTFWADSLRALVMALAFVLLGQAVAIVALYARARALAKHATGVSRTKTRQMGLLPTHVILVSVAFLALVYESAARTWARVGSDVSPWTWFNLAVFGVAAVAMWQVMAFERTRIAEAKRMMLFRVDPPQGTVAVDERDHHTEHSDQT